MIIQHAGHRLECRRALMQKPISVFSKDPTDFAYKKYIEAWSEWYLDGEPIEEERAMEIVKEWQET